jgi:hypothetical protein
MIWIGYALLGMLVGGLSGLLGIGGGLFIIPALVFLFGYSQQAAQGTSLAVMLPPISIFAVIQYWRQGFVEIKPSVLIAVCFTLGAWLISSYISRVPEVLLRRLFGLILAFTAGQMLLGDAGGFGARALGLAGALAAALGGGLLGSKRNRKQP